MLRLPDAGDWRGEYTFAAAYGQKGFSPTGVEAMWKQLSTEGSADDTFRKFYNVSRGELSANGLEAWTCAIGYADPAAFAKCYCGE